MAIFRFSSFVRIRRDSLYFWIKVVILSLALTSLSLHVFYSNIHQVQIEHPSLNLQEKLNDAQLDTDEIQLKMQEANTVQTVLNEDLYRKLHNESLVIVVQVHNRLEHLEHLIESLSRAKHIEDTLLIFSHDFFNEEINKLIRGISFCKVMQIFFPFSIQTHPDSFPGTDPRDCPRNLKKRQALEMGCLNANHPDKFGHYREAKYAQIKHHWWWKLNHVFLHLRATRNFAGLVVLLEEDHYVMEDFIHMLRLMDGHCKNTPQCHFLGLGNVQPLAEYKLDATFHQAQMQFAPTNLGLAFNRRAFLDKILTCVDAFCTFDDYNWDWSLYHVLKVCHTPPVLSMVSSAPRAFHIGNCGTHSKAIDCNVTETVSLIENAAKTLKKFPKSLMIDRHQLKQTKLIVNGGWGDKRDHVLCINITENRTQL